MKTIDRHRARLELARKRVEELLRTLHTHRAKCLTCTGLSRCDASWLHWCDVYEAIGRRKEAESVLREARRHG